MIEIDITLHKNKLTGTVGFAVGVSIVGTLVGMEVTNGSLVGAEVTTVGSAVGCFVEGRNVGCDVVSLVGEGVMTVGSAVGFFVVGFLVGLRVGCILNKKRNELMMS